MEVIMAFCKNCGYELESDAAFCPGCGKAVQKENTEQLKIWDVSVGVQPSKMTETTLVYKIQNDEIPPNAQVRNAEIQNWTPLHQTQIWKDNASDQARESMASVSQTAAPDAQETAAEAPSLPPVTSKKSHGALITILAVVLFAVIVIIGIIVGLNKSTPPKDSTPESVTVPGDTSGTVHFNVWLLDAQTYNTMIQLNLTPTTDQFNHLVDIPWANSNVTVDQLSSFGAKNLLSKQGNQAVGQYTQQILIFEAITYGSSGFANYNYRLVGLYVNGQAATGGTYLYDGDNVQAIIVMS